MEYSKRLLSSMEKDLQIFPEGRKGHEFNQCLVYSALAEWVRCLVYGESNGELGEEKEQACVDILYVQHHLAKIADAFVDFFHIPEAWLGSDQRNSGSSLASQVIQDMIFTGNIMEIHRDLYPVPLHYYKYEDGLYLALGDSILAGRLFKTVGTSKWAVYGQQNKELEKIARIRTPIVDIPIDKYCEKLDAAMPWQVQEPEGYYQIFKTGSTGKYSECWVPLEVTALPQGLSMIRSCDDFNKAYFLVRRTRDKVEMAALDPWYIETKEYYRILYALNRQQSCPGGCTVQHKGNFYYLKLWSALPNQEQRLLMDCSWPHRTYDDRYARIIPERFWGIIRRMLGALEIEIIEN